MGTFNLACPYCGSDRVFPVRNSLTGEESYFCRSCDMEWDELEQVRAEIEDGNGESPAAAGCAEGRGRV